MTDQLLLDMVARDQVLTRHQRRELVRWLEWESYRASGVSGDGWLGDGSRTPVTANTCRAILRAWDLDFPDTRFLGGVFPSSRWVQVGEVHSDSGKCHARKIRQFLPRDGVAVPPVDRPAWVGSGLTTGRG